ncbi:MAG: L,D-transpeptidase family protein [Patescibacteria group bacterium]|nr:L,D-transpeptidase family protein [Patescibacteria group bacterium]
MKRFIYLILPVFGLFLFIIPKAQASDYRSPEIRIYDGAKVNLENSWLAYAEGFKGGASVAIGDVNGDGDNEIIVGAGPGGGPNIRVLRADGSQISTFFVYPQSFRGGIKVAACDLNNDGTAEIVTGSGEGGGPHVRTLTYLGEAIFTPGFYAFHPDFRGGINVACGDVDGDSFSEIVTGVGVGARPHVKVFDRFGVSKNLDIYPYAERDQGGVDVAVGNVDGGKESEIITSIYRFGRSRIKTYKANAQRTILAEFEGWPEAVQTGFQIASGDLDRDGFNEILVAVAAGGGPQVRAFEGSGKIMPQNFFAYESDFRGGVHLAIGDIDKDGQNEIITAPGRKTIQGRTDYYKYIEVNIKEQRLYAYKNGMLDRTFLVSTGINKYPTPTGNFEVLAKIPTKDYEWSYGPNHPDNYDLKDVDFNLRFNNGYYLHYAYWHNNFGHKMSHGCININRENSEWLYNWAYVGVPVIVHQ